MATDLDLALAAKDAYQWDLLSIPGVVGVGVCHDEHVRVYLKHASAEALLPDDVAGVDIDPLHTGPIRSLGLVTKYPGVKALDAFVRPVSGGNSVGAYLTRLNGYATGTLGMNAMDTNGNLVTLSCNHCWAFNTVQHGGNQAGQSIFAPGTYFGGADNATDDYATLARFGAIDEVNANQVDWAVGAVAQPSNVSTDILNIGTPTAIADAQVNQQVAKMGALSGLTNGYVTDTNATIEVNYENQFTATFENQIVVQGLNGAFGEAGDSGSAVVTKTSDGTIVAVGLLFSGSSTVTIVNKMPLVAQAAGLSLPTMTLATPSPPVYTQSPYLIPALAGVGILGLVALSKLL